MTNSFWNYLQRRNRIDPSWKATNFEKMTEWSKTPNDKSPNKYFNNDNLFKDSPYQRSKQKQENNERWPKKPSLKLNKNSFIKPSNSRATFTKSNPKRKTITDSENGVNIKTIYGLKAKGTRETRYK